MRREDDVEDSVKVSRIGRMLLKRYRYTPISWLSCFKFILNRLARRFSNCNGFFFPFNLRDIILLTDDNYLFKVHDPACLSIIKRDSLIIHTILRHVSPTSTVVDIGAHVGSISIRIADNVRRVIAIEPDPRNFIYLLENIRLNRKRNIIPILAGVGAEDSIHVFKLLRDSTHSTFNNSHYTREIIYSAYVPIYKLDNIVRQLESSIEELSIDLVKIDVEKLELEVIIGAVEVLRKYRPILLVEVHGRDRLDKILDLLKKEELDYTSQILRIERGEEYDTIQLLLTPRSKDKKNYYQQ